ncbi:MAG: K(+)-insensitive pyrophosphate-energized proton pump [Candidatus Collierbacteria bacterium GW2011_GWB2_45_17]|uniref:K(+)-insensitive pyrophosphate-energized proton pump n=2 Tax=Candidatus Collieribacteriota TaxID=1752725 RepID=A0A837IGD9_9BACT|nr:MAG: K(+)-insensitive pyrophosphate-energized proton pump [Microgenomates group bacterium GW2011_GWC1_44_23]KKT95393.1 MAG: K(+)-insensitive pyrophosphate-energized proton pump [Candidatus Collierbacteria bacterium GW2011_GWA1_45_15]KKU00043.1 MAG: K(+)-insensitive pyrophosphate-energized proton pump [Candidatus Collierbacteria bacterium GW2011_GWB2_45_17]KKU08430.1 MAG: K(+)-insensitive pyrophosphate-energized proton pump [Candidatus Collierbacteria bacterium GW2011_GWC2_45_40]HBC45055.1 so
MDIQLIALFTAPIVSIIALVYGYFLSKSILKEDKGNAKLQQIAKAVKDGAMSYLATQFKLVFPIMLILAALIAYTLGVGIAVTFIIGASFSAIIGYFGMLIAVEANVRTANNATKSLNAALQTSFRAGTVNGMLVVGLGLLGVSLIYMYSYFTYVSVGPEAIAENATHILVGYGFGAALLALFMRVGGGIFTKAADVGADLVGKVEKGIPEDDPRNPATIADNVGDNVGDCAGMAADVFESYALTIVAAMILGGAMFGLAGVVFPLLARSGSILTSILGTFFVKAKNDQEDPLAPLIRGFMVSAVSAIAIFMGLSTYLLGEPKAGYASVVGIIAMLALLYITKYYTGPGEKPIIGIAKASQTGAGTNLIAGLSYGMESTFVSVLVVAGAIFAGYSLLGFYGISLAGMGMLATTGIIMALDTFGPIADNAQGMVEMAGLKGKAQVITGNLDAVGNTTKALTKGFAVGSAAVAASSLFATYFEATGLSAINISNPKVFIGVLIGGALPFLFSSRLIGSVGRAAFEVVEEVRRQFREIKGIMEGKTLPDYSKAIAIVTAASQKELLIPAAIVISLPIITALLGAEALGGFLAGTVVVGLMLALFMCNTGGAWDNAKKYIEDGNMGGKGSDAHKASVVGDTVGDPLKDTAGPALNPMMKIVQIVALLIAPMVMTLIGK